MESSPPTTENSPESKKSGEKKKNSAKALKGFVAELQSEQGHPRQTAPEANQLHGKKPSPERIGHVLVSAEAEPAKKTAEQTIDKAATNKNVETLSRADLLNLSEQIVVENTNLRRIYETHLIGERGLRRLVVEYLRGGDIKQALKQELLEHEIDFERDPILRDRMKQTKPATNDALNNLLQQVGASAVGNNQDELAMLKAREAYQASQHEYQQQRRRRIIDVTLISTILILVALVALLVISRL